MFQKARAKSQWLSFSIVKDRVVNVAVTQDDLSSRVEACLDDLGSKAINQSQTKDLFGGE